MQEYCLKWEEANLLFIIPPVFKIEDYSDYDDWSDLLFNNYCCWVIHWLYFIISVEICLTLKTIYRTKYIDFVIISLSSFMSIELSLNFIFLNIKINY